MRESTYAELYGVKFMESDPTIHCHTPNQGLRSVAR